MSEVSIQVRRVTERVKQYFSIFNMRTHSRMRPGRSIIRGSKRLGFDEVECVVSETSRGTSVGFYAINRLQGLLYSVPFLFILLLNGLTLVPEIRPYLTGISENFVPVDFTYIFSGQSTFGISFVLVILGLGLMPLLVEVIIQQIRLENLKSRFSFYSRDAVWETREIPKSLISLSAFRSVFMHGWLVAIIYFSGLAATDDTVSNLSTIYNSSVSELEGATIQGFSITVGLVIGLLTAYKAIQLRKEFAPVDDRAKISGSLTERRVDPVIFGIEAALLNGFLFLMFLSVTYFRAASFTQAILFMFFTVIGAIIGGLIHEEGNLWMISAYAIFIFFSSLALIFQTGDIPGYAYIIIVQLFIVPIPFLTLLSTSIGDVLEKRDIKTKQWLFDIVPLTSFITLFIRARQQQATKKAYEEAMEEDIDEEALDGKIIIRKDILQDKDSNAYKMVRHYYELIFSYTASFDSDQFVVLPTINQLTNWWTKKTGKSSNEEKERFVQLSDQLLWDPEFTLEEEKISRYEEVGKDMVLAVK